ncbi:MAG: hypothetical protein U1G07_27905, partial [Verrucomicrobiota bacterium]
MRYTEQPTRFPPSASFPSWPGLVRATVLLIGTCLAWVGSFFSPAFAGTPYPNEQPVTVGAGRTEVVTGPFLKKDHLYAILVYLPKLAGLGEKDILTVAVSDSAGGSIGKKLHAGDPDFYAAFKPGADGSVTIRLAADGPDRSTATFALRYAINPIEGATGPSAILASLPNSDWRHAQRFELGTTVYSSNDERPYIPRLAEPVAVMDDLVAGPQWFTFDYAGSEKKLVHFVVDVLDRDVPVDVALFTQSKDQPDALQPDTDGMEQYNTEQSTRSHGLQKFIARVIGPGTYFVRVMGNHPFFRLRTVVYDPPPYTDPAKAIRVGLDYLLRKGDSWHANTPRRGSVVLRTSNRMGETAQCVACHPTHFTTRAELIGVENGWPIRERAGLQFLTERLYNNPRPLYGTPDAVWARMISAPGNVISRIAYMLTTFERNVSEEQREGLLEP